MCPFYLGINLHLKRTYLVLMNQTGEIIDEQQKILPTNAGSIFMTLGGLEPPT